MAASTFYKDLAFWAGASAFVFLCFTGIAWGSNGKKNSDIMWVLLGFGGASVVASVAACLMYSGLFPSCDSCARDQADSYQPV